VIGISAIKLTPSLNQTLALFLCSIGRKFSPLHIRTKTDFSLRSAAFFHLADPRVIAAGAMAIFVPAEENFTPGERSFRTFYLHWQSFFRRSFPIDESVKSSLALN
jgi:hypothetical protein